MMFQIREDDLADLEHTLPEILLAMYPQVNNRLRVQWCRVRDIVMNVRWNYGPPLECEVIPASDDEAKP